MGGWDVWCGVRGVQAEQTPDDLYTTALTAIDWVGKTICVASRQKPMSQALNEDGCARFIARCIVIVI